ncbi:MAG: hypothetical protein ACK55Z_07745 [bacterium]
MLGANDLNLFAENTDLYGEAPELFFEHLHITAFIVCCFFVKLLV